MHIIIPFFGKYGTYSLLGGWNRQTAPLVSGAVCRKASATPRNYVRSRRKARAVVSQDKFSPKARDTTRGKRESLHSPNQEGTAPPALRLRGRARVCTVLHRSAHHADPGGATAKGKIRYQLPVPRVLRSRGWRSGGAAVGDKLERGTASPTVCNKGGRLCRSGYRESICQTRWCSTFDSHNA